MTIRSASPFPSAPRARDASTDSSSVSSPSTSGRPTRSPATADTSVRNSRDTSPNGLSGDKRTSKGSNMARRQQVRFDTKPQVIGASAAEDPNFTQKLDIALQEAQRGQSLNARSARTEARESAASSGGTTTPAGWKPTVPPRPAKRTAKAATSTTQTPQMPQTPPPPIPGAKVKPLVQPKSDALRAKISSGSLSSQSTAVSEDHRLSKKGSFESMGLTAEQLPPRPETDSASAEAKPAEVPEQPDPKNSIHIGNGKFRKPVMATGLSQFESNARWDATPQLKSGLGRFSAKVKNLVKQAVPERSSAIKSLVGSVNKTTVAPSGLGQLPTGRPPSSAKTTLRGLVNGKPAELKIKMDAEHMRHFFWATKPEERSLPIFLQYCQQHNLPVQVMWSKGVGDLKDPGFGAHAQRVVGLHNLPLKDLDFSGAHPEFDRMIAFAAQTRPTAYKPSVIGPDEDKEK